jgi:hypothetical protein
MSVTVFLANKGFTLPATDFDERRREAYFKNPNDPKNQLLPEEDKILRELGINKENADCLTQYLAQFFKELPKCQSDASLALSKDCEVVQYVLWQTLLAARTRGKTMYDENLKKKHPLADISVAINKQIINDLKPKPEALNNVDRIFTLIMKGSVPVVSPISETTSALIKEVVQPKPKDVDKVFTLILPGQADENPKPITPSPPPSEAAQNNAGSAITAPSVSSESSTSSRSSWFTRKSKTPFTKDGTQVNFNGPVTAPNRPSWYTRKVGKKPLSSGPPTQGYINLGGPNDTFQGENPMLRQRSPINHESETPLSSGPPTQGYINLGGPNDTFQGENPMLRQRLPINHEGETPFTQRSTEIPLGGPEQEEPSDNRQGESPFTQRSTEINLGTTPAGILSVVPDAAEINNQCQGKPRPTDRESHEEEFKRSLYYFYSVKNQEAIDLNIASLNQETETRFINDWGKAIKNAKDKISASLKFLDVPEDKLSDLNGLYQNFINGGERPNPILAHGCNKIGETASGFLERFYQSVERTPSERTYLFQHADWSSGAGSHINLETPTSVNAVDISVRDTKVDQQYKNADIHNLTILTTRDIDYVENDAFGFNYNIQGRHITDYLLIRDLFAKNKNYVLDISPQLIYLFYKERNIPRPTPDGQSITINDAFLKNAFDGNHIPPQLSSNIQVQAQVDMAYYAICNTLTVTDNKPYRFYSKPTSMKLNDIIEWLENATDRQYQPIKNLMKWAVPTETPLEKSVLLDLFKSVAKKPQSFFNRMFTRKNKADKSRAKTLKNNAAEVNAVSRLPQFSATIAPPQEQPPTTIRPLPNTRGILPIESARQQQVPQRLLLEAPERPKRNTKGMNDVRATLEKAKAKANANRFLQSAQSEFNTMRAQSRQEAQATDEDHTIVLQPPPAPTRTFTQRFKNMFKGTKKNTKVASVNNISYYENGAEQGTAPAAPAQAPAQAQARAPAAPAQARAQAQAPAQARAPAAPAPSRLDQLDSAIAQHEATIRELSGIITQKTGEYQTKKDQAVTAGKQRNTAKSTIVRNLANKKALNFTRSARTINGELTKYRQQLAVLQQSLQRLQNEKTSLVKKVLANAQAALRGARDQNAAIARIIQPRISPEEEASLQEELNAL